ncbi:MAG: Glutathione transport system permease protein GsiC [Dehalococcoidia bacterium]|nr:Glutathione transport system permease protein GsiC [Bacillota bacterium]
MTQYIIRRLLITLPLLLVITIIIFSMIRLVPGCPARVMAGIGATEEDIERIRIHLGLDRHPVEQYFTFIGNLLRGDMGISTRTRLPVTEEIIHRLPHTLRLAAAAMLIATVLGMAAGIIAGTKQNSIVDYLTTTVALFGLSMPVFWLGLLLMLLFSLHLGWLPATGAGTWGHLILPAFTLGVSSTAIITRMTRSSMLEVIRMDYVRTARAKGLTERLVVLRHALKNALIPVVTVIGLQTGFLLGGAVLTETVFAWPGIGRLLVGAILARDYPVVQGVALVIAAMFILANLVVDIIYAYLDPRIHYQ